MRVTSFSWLWLAALGAASSVVVGCSSDDSSSSHPPDASVSDTGSPDGMVPSEAATSDAGDDSSDLPPTPPGWDQPVTRPTDSAASSGRASCAFARGDMPAKTLGTSTPIDTAIPIDTIVVVMMENRSFDSMFGKLNEFGSRTGTNAVNEPPAGASNPASAANWDAGAPATDAGVVEAGVVDGGAEAGTPEGGAGDGGSSFAWQHAPSLCFADTNHSWRGQHWSWDNGLNDGFYAENNGNADNGETYPGSLLDGQRALWFYDQNDIPFDYSLANTFAIADNYFCSILGPTGPNRLFLVASTSFGLTYNTIPNNISQNIADNVVLADELEQRHVSWATYSDGTPSLVDAISIGIATRYPQSVRFAFQDFLNAAKAGTLPSVAWVDPKVGLSDGTATNNDDHPPADIQVGSQFLSQVYQAVTTSPQWAHTALFITWDENGGEYDHVPPPSTCAPDTTPPQLTGTDQGIAGDFTRLGFRVPLLVVSPYAKKGYASHVVYDHTSISRFIEARFKVPALSKRDANADPLMDLFDVQNPPAFLTPPTIATPEVDDAGLQSCIQIYGQ